jgi:hypothetical protein
MPAQYTADKDDLFYPAKNAAFFPNGRPSTDGALCAELARLAYAQLGSGAPDPFAFDRDRINKILGRIGFTSCTFFEAGPAGNGSHGFLAVDDTNHLAVLVFRGTDKDDPTDLTDDFNAIPAPWPSGGKVHSGFASALSCLWGGQTGIGAALHSLNGVRLLITGHSLGAAMATLAANLHPPHALYTFGSPRVGDQAFVDQMASIKNFRFVDCCDIVARIPPPNVLGYQHIRASGVSTPTATAIWTICAFRSRSS